MVFINDSILSLTSEQNVFVFTFDSPLKNVVSIEIIRSRVPATEYTVENSRNVWFYNGSYLIFQNRNYNSGELAATMMSQIPSLTISEIPRTGVFNYISNTSFTLNGGTAFRQLGLLSNTDHDAALVNTSYVVTAPNRYDLSGTQTVYVWLYETDALTNLENGFMFLGEIYLSTLGENNLQQSYDIPMRYFNPISYLNKLTIYFYSDYGRTQLYNFRGIPWSMQLRIRMISTGINWSDTRDISKIY